MKGKSLIIMGMILFARLLLYLLYKCLQGKMKPRQSLSRFFIFTSVLFLLIFPNTFLLVFTIELKFPDA